MLRHGRDEGKMFEWQKYRSKRLVSLVLLILMISSAPEEVWGMKYEVCGVKADSSRWSEWPQFAWYIRYSISSKGKSLLRRYYPILYVHVWMSFRPKGETSQDFYHSRTFAFPPSAFWPSSHSGLPDCITQAGIFILHSSLRILHSAHISEDLTYHKVKKTGEITRILRSKAIISSFRAFH